PAPRKIPSRAAAGAYPPIGAAADDANQRAPMAGLAGANHSGAMEYTSAPRKLFVVEDAPAIRARLVELLDEIDDVCIVGEAESPAEAVAGIFETRPHCVVLDFRLTGGTGVDVLRAVHP